jgi:predicted enzyme related to lactoylglutathione lyase
VKIDQKVLVFDAADLTSESKFWGGVLGGTVKVYDRWHMVFLEGKPVLGIQLAPDHVPPNWPDGAPQQVHLDLWVDDIETAHEEVMSLGARLLRPAQVRPADAVDNHQVYADPAGHPFCLCWNIKTT